MNMDQYEKGERRELELPDLQLPLVDNAVHMRVNYGSKIRNLMGYAIKKMKEPAITQMTWNGSQQAITKAITCAEIMKRKIKGLHQINKVYFKRVEEYWEPKIEGLERLKVNRDYPAMTILLSKTELDSQELGYQAPGSFDALWKQGIKDEKKRSDRRQHYRVYSAPSSSHTSEYQPPSFKKHKGKRKGTGFSQGDKQDVKKNA